MKRSWQAFVPQTDRARAALAAGSLWVLRYWLAYGFHLRRSPEWGGWFDQGRYAESALAFAQGDLSAAHHWYPAVYALLAAPFTAIFPGDPFFPVNAVLFAATFLGFASVVARFGIGPWQALLILVLTSLTVGSLARLWIIPWTTSASAALIWLALAQAMRMLRLHRCTVVTGAGDRDWWLLGLLVGAMPLVRPVDAATGGLILLIVIMAEGGRGHLTMRHIGLVILGAAMVIVPYGLLHFAIYGPAPSRYMVESARQGFAFADLPWKAYVLLVTAQPWYPGAASLGEELPWLPVGLAGLLIIAVRPAGGRSKRMALAVVAAAALLSAVPFLAYTDLQPSGLWRFNNAHYFKWLFPLFGVGVWIWLKALITERRILLCVALLAVAIVPAFIRLVPRRVEDDVPARLLTFAGRTDRDWNDAYFSPSVVVDREGVLHNVREFHQLPDNRGERAVAITRLFSSSPRRNDIGEAPRFAGWEAPDGRYAVRVKIGWPCWFAREACRGDLPQQ